MNKKCRVVFANDNLENDFNNINDNRLGKHLKRAVDDIKSNIFCGVKIPHKLIPREYISKYKSKNAWKYDLPGGWRLIYCISPEKNAEIIAIVLEWFDHKSYLKRFGYKVRERLISYF